MNADAASRGATVDPGLATQAHDASNVRNILTGSYGAQLLAQGANTRQQYTDRGVTAQQQQGETLGQARQKLADLLAEKGAYKTSDAQTIISNTFSNALKQALEKGQLGNYKSESAARKAQVKVSQQNANTSTQNAKQSHQQWAQSSNKYGVTNGEWANWSLAKRQAWIKALPSSKGGNGSATKPASGPGSLPTVTEQKRVSTIRKIAQFYRTGIKVQQKQPDGTFKDVYAARPGDIAAVTDQLQQTKGIDPLAISVGLDLYNNNGKLSHKGVNAAHRYGVHVGGNFGIVNPVTPSTNSQTYAGGAGSH